MIRDTLLLLHLQYVTFKKEVKRAKWLTFAIMGLGFVMIMILAGLSAGAGLLAGSFVLSAHWLGDLEWFGPAILLTLAIFVFTLGGFINAMGTLYLSSDLELLMVAPVDRRAIFLAKMLRGMGSSYAFLTILGAPALITYGAMLQFATPYFALGIAALAGVPLFGAALGALATMLLARFAPAGRVREAMSAFASLIALAFYIVMRLGDVWMRNGNTKPSAPNVVEIGGFIQTLLNAPLPTYWAGHALAAAGHNNLLASATQVAVYLLLTFGLFVFTVVVANQLYGVGWLRMQGSGIARRQHRRNQRPGLLSHLPFDFAFMLKDWPLRLRDLRLIVQMISSVVMLVVWLIAIVYSMAPKQDSETASRLSDLSAQFSNAILAAGVLLMGVMVLDTVVLTGISMEGTALWLLKVAPVSGWRIIRGKFAVVGLPFVVLTTVILLGVGLFRQMNLLWLAYGWLCIQLLGLTLLCFGVCMSVPWAKLDWDDPKKMNAGLGGCLYLIGKFVYGVPAALALCVPLLLARVSTEQLPLVILLALSVSLFWSLLFNGPAIAYACRAWKRLGEPINARASNKVQKDWLWGKAKRPSASESTFVKDWAWG